MADATLAGLRTAAASRSAERVAGELVALFEQLMPQADKLQWVQRAVATDLGAGNAALARAMAAVAKAIDAQAADFDRHGYHNRQHFCEVALSAYALCLLARHDAETTQLAVLAGLIHDAVHAGSPQPAFVQERASVERMRPLLDAAGVSAGHLAQLTVLVLTTDPVAGTAFMAAACHAPADGVAPPPAGAPELAALTANSPLTQLARLLCEADVLPSLGLGAVHAARTQERLSREWQRPLGPHDKLAFVDGVLQQGYMSALFRPSVLAMRVALAGGLHAPAAV